MYCVSDLKNDFVVVVIVVVVFVVLVLDAELLSKFPSKSEDHVKT